MSKYRIEGILNHYKKLYKKMSAGRCSRDIKMENRIDDYHSQNPEGLMERKKYLPHRNYDDKFSI